MEYFVDVCCHAKTLDTFVENNVKDLFRRVYKRSTNIKIDREGITVKEHKAH